MIVKYRYDSYGFCEFSIAHFVSSLLSSLISFRCWFGLPAVSRSLIIPESAPGSPLARAPFHSLQHTPSVSDTLLISHHDVFRSLDHRYTHPHSHPHLVINTLSALISHSLIVGTS